MTLEQFNDEIQVLNKAYPNRDLEEYLLAIYKNLSDHLEEYTAKHPSLDDILFIIKDAFVTSPAQFDEAWLQITESPDLNRISRKFTNPELADSIDKNKQTIADNMEFTLQVLRFQIAELHKMNGKQLEDEYRYFGIDSETGNRWYNFDPFTNLSCGVSCMQDNETTIDKLDWSFLGDLLEDGRIYE